MKKLQLTLAPVALTAPYPEVLLSFRSLMVGIVVYDNIMIFNDVNYFSKTL